MRVVRVQVEQPKLDLDGHRIKFPPPGVRQPKQKIQQRRLALRLVGRSWRARDVIEAFNAIGRRLCKT